MDVDEEKSNSYLAGETLGYNITSSASVISQMQMGGEIYEHIQRSKKQDS